MSPGTFAIEKNSFLDLFIYIHVPKKMHRIRIIYERSNTPVFFLLLIVFVPPNLQSCLYCFSGPSCKVLLAKFWTQSLLKQHDQLTQAMLFGPKISILKLTVRPGFHGCLEYWRLLLVSRNLPGTLTAGTYKSPIEENDLPNLHDYVPCESSSYHRMFQNCRLIINH